MRVAIPADGVDLDAPTSSVFGRCQAYLFVDSETLEFEGVPNPALDAPGGAGIQAAQFVLQRGAEAILAPRVGPNAFRVIAAAGVPVYEMNGSTVREAAAAFQDGQLVQITLPGADHVAVGRGHRRRSF